MAIEQRIQSLELLRFLAALSVVCIHTPALYMGNFGVDVFFIISGYVMMVSTAKNADQFLTKRLVRVVPTYWIVTVAVFAIAWVAPTALGDTTANFAHLGQSLLFIPFDKNGIGHFPLLTVGWTLNYEMYFYVLFFCACLISHTYRALIASGLLVVIILIAGALDGFLAEVYSDPIILEFAFGMLLYTVMADRNRRVIIGVGLLILVGLVSYGTLDHRAIVRGGPALATVIVCMALFRGRWRPPLAAPLGAISYALYVIHPFPLGAVSKMVPWFDSGVAYQEIMASLLVVVLSVGAAFVFYYVVERPLTGALRRRFVRKRPPPQPGAELITA